MAATTIGNLRRFERRTSTGSEAFFLFICLDAIKFSLLTFFSLLKTIYPRVLTKPLPNDAKSPLPVDVRRLKTLLLKVITNTNKVSPTQNKPALQAINYITLFPRLVSLGRLWFRRKSFFISFSCMFLHKNSAQKLA